MVPFGLDPKEAAALQGQTASVLSEIERNRAYFTEDFGKYQTQVLETGRVLLIPEGETDREQWLVCYLVEGHLIVDDYVEELADPEDKDPREIPIESPDITPENP